MSEVLALEGVAKAYNPGTPAAVTVLDGAELALGQGEVVALVAPSGAGKSTLLHIAGLLDTPTGGTVRLLGEATDGLGDADRTRLRRDAIGFVYQFHHLLPEFSALENVVLPQRAAGQARAPAEARAKRAPRGGRPVGAARAPPRRALGGRAAARRLRPGARQPAAAPARRRADRQPRRRDLVEGLRPAAGARPRHRPDRARRHPQPRPRCPHGPDAAPGSRPRRRARQPH